MCTRAIQGWMFDPARSKEVQRKVWIGFFRGTERLGLCVAVSYQRRSDVTLRSVTRAERSNTVRRWEAYQNIDTPIFQRTNITHLPPSASDSR
jgi:hypothetical protein